MSNLIKRYHVFMDLLIDGVWTSYSMWMDEGEKIPYEKGTYKNPVWQFGYEHQYRKL